MVKEEIQSAEKRLLVWNTKEVTTSKERQLQLKLSDEVSDPILTGKLLKGKKDNPLKVVLVVRETGRVVKNEPISFAKVEILVLDASCDDNWTVENFNNRIIRVGDKKRPHFSKNVYIDLKGGVGFLSDVKLGHDSRWMKSCKCRLGARIVKDFRGVNVQEGWTCSFMVEDSRSKQYEKRYPPSRSDKVWRLDNISRNGARCKRLNMENVETVEDFLFLLSADRHKLQKLVGAGAKWDATVDHALTCPKDDKLSLHYYHSTESKMGVIFDALGGLKGIIDNSHYVPIDDLSCDEKDSARKLLVSAFKNREARTCFDDKAALLRQFPYRWNVINSPKNSSSIQEGSNGNCLSVSEYIDRVEPGVSCQINDAYVTTLDRFASTDMGQMFSPMLLDVPIPFLFPDPGTNTAFSSPNNMLHFGSPRLPSHEPSYLCVQSPSYDFNCQLFTDSWSLMSLINSDSSNNISEGHSSLHALEELNWDFQEAPRLVLEEPEHKRSVSPVAMDENIRLSGLQMEPHHTGRPFVRFPILESPLPGQSMPPRSAVDKIKRKKSTKTMTSDPSGDTSSRPVTVSPDEADEHAPVHAAKRAKVVEELANLPTSSGLDLTVISPEATATTTFARSHSVDESLLGWVKEGPDKFVTSGSLNFFRSREAKFPEDLSLLTPELANALGGPLKAWHSDLDKELYDLPLTLMIDTLAARHHANSVFIEKTRTEVSRLVERQTASTLNFSRLSKEYVACQGRVKELQLMAEGKEEEVARLQRERESAEKESALAKVDADNVRSALAAREQELKDLELQRAHEINDLAEKAAKQRETDASVIYVDALGEGIRALLRQDPPGDYLPLLDVMRKYVMAFPIDPDFTVPIKDLKDKGVNLDFFLDQEQLEYPDEGGSVPTGEIEVTAVEGVAGLGSENQFVA